MLISIMTKFDRELSLYLIPRYFETSSSFAFAARGVSLTQKVFEETWDDNVPQ